MAKFVFGYHGGGGMQPTEEEMAAEMAKWEAWYGELGAAIVDPGAPFGASQTVAADGSVTDGGGANPLTGYTIVQAADVASAVAMAKGCPILANGGSVEVAEALDMG